MFFTGLDQPALCLIAAAEVDAGTAAAGRQVALVLRFKLWSHKVSVVKETTATHLKQGKEQKNTDETKK